MKLLNMICKELGVKIGEDWIGSDGWCYCINDSGELINKEYKDNLEEDEFIRLDNISRVLLGELKPVWKPKEGDIYYFPYMDMIEDKRFAFLYWRDTAKDKWYLENGLAFKTEEEAIAAANKMLEAIKE